MKNDKQTYFGNIFDGISSLWKGLGIAMRHFKDSSLKSRTPIGVDHPDYFKQDTGIVTLEYPHEAIPVPDHGRYRLHNEIDDCIVCDLCAKICPVNCIEIEPVKSTEEIGKTSDGSTKRIYAAKFDIDMAKCCYCGLCTTVCPTECLTMTKTFDYSEYDIRNMIYHYTDLSPEQSEQKKKEYEEKMKEKEREKEKAKAEAEKAKAETKEAPAKDVENPPAAQPKKVVFKPVIKPPAPKKDGGEDKSE